MKTQKGLKKMWVTPQLVIHGDIEKLTTEGLPPKVFGNSDGATWGGQSVKWAS